MLPESAITSLEQVLTADQASVIVADTDWHRFQRAFTSTRLHLDPPQPPM
jgi:hypothetical protein